MLSRILDFVKKNLGKLSAFLVVFCVIKLTVFAAPLLLSNSIPLQADYGYLEYLLGMGALIAPVLNLGLGGA